MSKKYIAVAVASLSLTLLPNTVIAQPGQPTEEPPEPEPVPVVEEVEPAPPPVSEAAMCNCWLYLKQTYYPDTMPPMADIIAGASSAFGDIAVFYYPTSGLYHFAYVTQMGTGYFVIDETNYHRCKKTERNISFTDPNLIGFYTP